jgi:hypothetical protein
MPILSQPGSLGSGVYTVRGPSFDERPTVELVVEFAWMRDPGRQIRKALLGRGRPLIAAVSYLNLLGSVDPRGH